MNGGRPFLAFHNCASSFPKVRFHSETPEIFGLCAIRGIIAQ